MNEEKLDQIISLLKAQTEELKKLNSAQSCIDEGLEKAKEYMMKNHNIVWLNDDLEMSVYDVIIDVIKKFI